MRKLFRDKGTGEFLCTNGEWTLDPKLGFNFFGNGHTVFQWAARGTRNVEWFYSFDDSQYDFTIDLPALIPVKPTSHPGRVNVADSKNNELDELKAKIAELEYHLTVLAGRSKTLKKNMRATHTPADINPLAARLTELVRQLFIALSARSASR